MKFRMRHAIALLCALWAWPLVNAQTGDLPLNHQLYHYIDRLDIKGLTGGTVHTDVKPYARSWVQDIFEKVDSDSIPARQREWHRLMRLVGDDAFALQNEGKGVLKQLYKNKRDFFYLDKKNIRLFINPILYLSAGGDQHDYNGAGLTENLFNYRNSRGVRVRGTAFGKLGFFTEVSENQVKYPQFVRNNYDEHGVLWGENFVKIFDADANPGFDFFNAIGYITYSPVKEFRIKFGKDRAFLGNGYQSLLLSDHATDYFFLNFNTRIWKLEYVNHFAQMTDFIRGKPDSYGVFPRKYAVFHQLFYKPWDWLSVGLFESVVYSPTLPAGNRGFELEYLNPLIFYRSVEQSLGSPDNSMLGLSWKANLLQRFQVYGQIMLDDFNFRNRDQGTGYWGNKYGWQAGLKYIDAFFLPGFDLQVEYNRVRPYTYSHFNPTANYSHYGQFLAHSMGANVHDLNVIARYQPFPRWHATAAVTSMFKGMDIDGDNYGGDIFRPYTLRVQDYNNTVGQGAAFDVMSLYGKLSYRLLELDGFAEIEARYRKENDITSMSILGSLRLNMPTRPIRF